MKIAHTLTAVLALGFSTVAFAQPAGRGPGGPGPNGPRGHRPPPVIAVLDANRDGVISADEIANAATSLKTLDKNGDGILSAEELHPQAPARPADCPPDATAPRRPRNPVMLALDADGNGELSAQEIANAPTSLKALDTNHDGQLTPDELRPLPPTND